MGFRNEEEARFHRIQALETELEERDRKIAALEEKLEGKRKPKKKSKPNAGDAATSAPAAKVPKVAGVPEVRRWKMAVQRPYLWLFGLAILAFTAGMAWFVSSSSEHSEPEAVPLLTLQAVGTFAMSLYALHRRYLILDKELARLRS